MFLQGLDGSMEQCFYCSLLGHIMSSDVCFASFCRPCIICNVRPKYPNNILAAQKWKCMKCDPSLIEEQTSDYTTFIKTTFYKLLDDLELGKFCESLCADIPRSSKVVDFNEK